MPMGPQRRLPGVVDLCDDQPESDRPCARRVAVNLIPRLELIPREFTIDHSRCTKRGKRVTGSSCDVNEDHSFDAIAGVLAPPPKKRSSPTTMPTPRPTPTCAGNDPSQSATIETEEDKAIRVEQEALEKEAAKQARAEKRLLAQENAEKELARRRADPAYQLAEWLNGVNGLIFTVKNSADAAARSSEE